MSALEQAMERARAIMGGVIQPRDEAERQWAKKLCYLEAYGAYPDTLERYAGLEGGRIRSFEPETQELHGSRPRVVVIDALGMDRVLAGIDYSAVEVRALAHAAESAAINGMELMDFQVEALHRARLLDHPMLVMPEPRRFGKTFHAMDFTAHDHANRAALRREARTNRGKKTYRLKGLRP